MESLQRTPRINCVINDMQHLDDHLWGHFPSFSQSVNGPLPKNLQDLWSRVQTHIACCGNPPFCLLKSPFLLVTPLFFFRKKIQITNHSKPPGGFHAVEAVLTQTLGEPVRDFWRMDWWKWEDLNLVPKCPKLGFTWIYRDLVRILLGFYRGWKRVILSENMMINRDEPLDGIRYSTPLADKPN